MDEFKINFSVDSVSVFAPVISASLVNAYFTALLLRKQSGEEITSQVEAHVLAMVVRQWIDLQGIISESWTKVLKKNDPKGQD